MIWLKLFLVLELGFLPRGDFYLYEPYPQINWFYDIAYTNIQGELLLWNHFYIIGGADTTVVTDTINNYFPIKSTYNIDIGLKYEMIKLGFRHYCVHPIISEYFLEEMTGGSQGAYEQIYLKIGDIH